MNLSAFIGLPLRREYSKAPCQSAYRKWSNAEMRRNIPSRCRMGWSQRWKATTTGVLTVVSTWLASCAFAQSNVPAFVKELNASFTEERIKVDGLLTEAAWQQAETASDFVQNNPMPGRAPSQPSEVRVLYDNDALYIGAFMRDSAPDSVLSQLTVRDELGNTDFFGVWFSCFRDGINAFQFTVTPSGIQADAQLSALGEDFAWNAVWQCNTAITDEGWIAEFKIPFSALRFPEKPEQVWDMNFFRSIRRHRELSYWQEVDPEVPGEVNQSGILRNIRGIKPPVRLFLYPYAIAYADIYRDNAGEVQVTTPIVGGMDLKYGINDAFTLDMALIPDFGQVRSDNQVLNLTPFEVFFEEQRQFFTEGTELFNKGGLFYSRRIGGRPVNYSRAFTQQRADEEIISSPTETPLINASKISGRNANGLGIGVFNAITNSTDAVLRDSEGNERRVQTQPLTNYSVLVADQNLGNNSYFTLINTNVTRSGNTYDANVTGTEFDVRSKKNSIRLAGGGAYSKKFGYDQPEEDDGFRYNLALEKINGQFNFGAQHNVMTKHYDHNDLGFLTANNFSQTGAWMSYSIFTPFGPFNSLRSNLGVFYEHLYQPNTYTGATFDGFVRVNTRSWDTFNFEFTYQPDGERDFFEPRVDGWFFQRPENYMVGGWVSTDYRRRLAIDIGNWNTMVPGTNWHSFDWRVSPRFRVNDKLMLIYVYSRMNTYNEYGFTDIADNGSIIFGERDVIAHTNVFTANYIFTNRMGLSFRLRHYWSTVEYQDFGALQRDGSVGTGLELWDSGAEAPDGFIENGTTRDRSYNAFNIDMIYTWVFSPGSELRIVWKNQIIDDTMIVPDRFDDNLERVFDAAQSNSISVRLLYFIDYMDFKRSERFIEN